MSDTDLELLARYVRHHAEDAFAELLQRHLGLVYSAALRQVRSPQLAEEVAQSVFIDLARSAAKLKPDTILSAWLYQVTRRTAIDAIRRESSRQVREQIALEMNVMNSTDSAWSHIEPFLDEAMHSLDDADRAAVLLRYFENKSLREVGAMLGTTDDAARKRVSRAVDSLREFLAKRGIGIGASGLVVIISANAVQAVPTGVSAGITAAVASATFTTTAIPTSGKIVAATKFQAASMAVVLLLVTGTIVYWRYPTKNLPRTARAQTNQSLVASSQSASATSSLGALLLQRNTNENAQLDVVAELREPFSTNVQATFDMPPGALAVQPDGKILAAATLGGWFVDEQSGTLGWYTRGVMRFEPDGSLDRTFFCDVNKPLGVSTMEAQLHILDRGRIFLSGSFSSVDGKPRHGHAILHADGRLDESFDPWGGATNVAPRIAYPRTSYSSAMMTDGSLAVMSRPVEGTNPQAEFLWAAYRLDATGRIVWPALTNCLLDETRPKGMMLTFSESPYGPFPEAPLELFRYAVRLPTGGAIVAMREPPYWGVHTATLKRFDKDWNVDPSFTNQIALQPIANEITLHLQRDGKLLIAGVLAGVNGENFSGLARLNTDGSTDRSFRCITGNTVERRIMAMADQPDGKILIGGFFGEVNGSPARHLARLNPDGSFDATFHLPFVSLAELQRRRSIRVARLSKPLAATATSPSKARESKPATSDAPAETILITGMRLEENSAEVRFKGQPGQLFILQAKETVSVTNWSNIDTNRSDANGTGLLRDRQEGKPMIRFYRIATP